MENNSSNYDMFDKLITNNKKAQSWTIFWVTALCLLAGAVLWMAFDISKKKKELILKEQTIKSQGEFLETKNHLIDSLVANCNVAKSEIVNTYDSVITQTEKAIKTIVNTNIDSGKPLQITETQQAKLKEVSKSIQHAKNNLNNEKTNTKKDIPRLFIQYNNKNDSRQIAILSGMLNRKKYYVAPPEYIDNNFPTIVKFYNYKNASEEIILLQLIAKALNLDLNSIPWKYETNPKIKSTIEIWIGTRPTENKK